MSEKRLIKHYSTNPCFSNFGSACGNMDLIKSLWTTNPNEVTCKQCKKTKKYKKAAEKDFDEPLQKQQG